MASPEPLGDFPATRARSFFDQIKEFVFSQLRTFTKPATRDLYLLAKPIEFSNELLPHVQTVGEFASENCDYLALFVSLNDVFAR